MSLKFSMKNSCSIKNSFRWRYRQLLQTTCTPHRAGLGWAGPCQSSYTAGLKCGWRLCLYVPLSLHWNGTELNRNHADPYVSLTYMSEKSHLKCSILKIMLVLHVSLLRWGRWRIRELHEIKLHTDTKQMTLQCNYILVLFFQQISLTDVS